jgi:hypothetical protein
MLKNLPLINAAWHILFLSETRPGQRPRQAYGRHDAVSAASGEPAAARLGFQAFTLEGVDISQPTKKPCGKGLTPEQQADNREIAWRRVRIEHVNSSIKRCRMLKEEYAADANAVAHARHYRVGYWRRGRQYRSALSMENRKANVLGSKQKRVYNAP